MFIQFWSWWLWSRPSERPFIKYIVVSRLALRTDLPNTIANDETQVLHCIRGSCRIILVSWISSLYILLISWWSRSTVVLCVETRLTPASSWHRSYPSNMHLFAYGFGSYAPFLATNCRRSINPSIPIPNKIGRARLATFYGFCNRNYLPGTAFSLPFPIRI